MSLFDSASLVVTPNGYKEDKLYSVIPTDGSGDLSVTRATTATRVNSAGLIEPVAYNLYTDSQEFSTSSWDKVSTTVTPNTTISPNGSTTADTIVISSGGYLYKQISYTSVVGDSLTMSIYTKNSNANFLIFGGATISGTDASQVLNVGNGWYRHIITRTFTTSTTGVIQFLLGYTFTGTFYIWGAQLVSGTSAKDYFPTTDRLNVPRLDYTGSTCPSILIEPQRTNLLTYSEQFDNAAWFKVNASVISNSITSPDGNNTADTLTISSGGYLLRETFPLSIISGQSYSISIYTKNQINDFLLFGGATPAGTDVYSIINSGNGWYRHIRTRTFSTTNASANIQFIIYDQIGVNYIWGGQLEAGGYATSYIPTTTAAVTRNADVISKTGISSLIGQTEGTIFAEIKVSKLLGTASRYIFHISDGTTNNRIYMAFSGSSSNVLRARVFNGGTLQCSIDTSAITTTGTYRLAMAYKSNDIVFYVNGTQIGTDTSASIPTCSRVDLGHNYAGASQLNDGITNANIWKTRLTNAELASLTSL
jgi:hypothetical protein